MKAIELIQDFLELLGNTEVNKPTDEPEPAPAMVSPLQQKLELLKKTAGVDNYFDKETQDPAKDELDILRHNAGIQPSAVIQLSTDESDI